MTAQCLKLHVFFFLEPLITLPITLLFLSNRQNVHVIKHFTIEISMVLAGGRDISPPPLQSAGYYEKQCSTTWIKSLLEPWSCEKMKKKKHCIKKKKIVLQPFGTCGVRFYVISPFLSDRLPVCLFVCLS